MFHVEVVKQFFQPIKQQVGELVAVHMYIDLSSRRNGVQVFDDGAEQSASRVDEERLEVRRTHAQAQVGGMLEVLVHKAMLPRRGRR